MRKMKVAISITHTRCIGAESIRASCRLLSLDHSNAKHEESDVRYISLSATRGATEIRSANAIPGRFIRTFLRQISLQLGDQRWAPVQ